MLRYSGHTLSFDEPTPLQLRWALYTTSRVAAWLTQRLTTSTRLRVDWLDSGDSRVGLTILPGRRDWHRDLQTDLAALRDQGVGRVLCLVPISELERYGVADLMGAYRAAELEVLHYPLKDQMGADRAGMERAVDFIDGGVAAGQGVLLHCVGGLGRSGMAAACWLTSRGRPPSEAIAIVRRCRGPRAVETATQESFVTAFTQARRG